MVLMTPMNLSPKKMSKLEYDLKLGLCYGSNSCHPTKKNPEIGKKRLSLNRMEEMELVD